MRRFKYNWAVILLVVAQLPTPQIVAGICAATCAIGEVCCGAPPTAASGCDPAAMGGCCAVAAPEPSCCAAPAATCCAPPPCAQPQPSTPAPCAAVRLPSSEFTCCICCAPLPSGPDAPVPHRSTTDLRELTDAAAWVTAVQFELSTPLVLRVAGSTDPAIHIPSHCARQALLCVWLK